MFDIAYVEEQAIDHPHSRNWQHNYRTLFADVFNHVSCEQLHSVSLGQFRLPAPMYKRMHQLYPEEKLFAWGLTDRDGQVSYREELAAEIYGFCSNLLREYINDDIFFPCPSTTLAVTRP